MRFQNRRGEDGRGELQAACCLTTETKDQRRSVGAYRGLSLQKSHWNSVRLHRTFEDAFIVCPLAALTSSLLPTNTQSINTVRCINRIDSI
jgi:hypothetical protein